MTCLSINFKCVVPQDIHTHPKKGHWIFMQGDGEPWGEIFKAKYEATLEFPEGLGCKPKNSPWGVVWIFPGTIRTGSAQNTV